jgi:hypothetical protein
MSNFAVLPIGHQEGKEYELGVTPQKTSIDAPYPILYFTVSIRLSSRPATIATIHGIAHFTTGVCII